MKTQTFPHNIVKELHDGDSAIRVVVEQLGVYSGCEEFSKGKERGGAVYRSLCSITWSNCLVETCYAPLLPVNFCFLLLTCIWAQPSPPPAGRLHN